MGKDIAKVDDIGITETDMMFIMIIPLMYIMMSTLVPMAQQLMTQQLGAQTFSGALDERVLNATGITKWINLVANPPYTGWLTVDFLNDGPDVVYIGINNPGPWKILGVGEAYPVNFLGSQRKIETIFYRCDPGGNASVRATGKYDLRL